VSPTGWALATYLVACAAVAASLSVLGQQRAGAVFGPLPWRFATAVALALVAGVGEVHGNLANLHWWLAGSLLVLLALPAPRTVAGKVAELTWIGLLACSGPLAIVALPMVVWRLGTDRSPIMLARGGLVAFCAGLTLAVALAGGRGPSAATSFVDIPALLAFRWLATLSVGDSTLRGEGPVATLLNVAPGQGYAQLPVVVQASALALGAALLILAIADGPGPSLGWLGSGMLATVASVLAGMNPAGISALLTPATASRFFFLLLFASVLVLMRGAAVQWGFMPHCSAGRRQPSAGAPTPSSTLRWAVVIGIAIMAVGSASDVRQPPLGPGSSDREMSQFVSCLESDVGVCELPIQPPGWTLRMPADS
jgi:hypothetical protein